MKLLRCVNIKSLFGKVKTFGFGYIKYLKYIKYKIISLPHNYGVMT